MCKNVKKGIIEKKEKPSKKASQRYQNLSQEEKEKKRQYGHQQYKNLLEDEYRQFFSRMQEIKSFEIFWIICMCIVKTEILKTHFWISDISLLT